MKLILILVTLIMTSCSSQVIVKNCKSYFGEYKRCELVE